MKELDTAGKISYVLATEYPDMLRRLVRPGTHAFVGEDLTTRVLMAQQFSESGKMQLNVIDIHVHNSLVAYSHALLSMPAQRGLAQAPVTST